MRAVKLINSRHDLICLTKILWWLKALVDFKLLEELYLSAAKSWHSYFLSVPGTTAMLNERQRAFRKHSSAQYNASCTLLMAIADTSRNVCGCFSKLACLSPEVRDKLSCGWEVASMTRIRRQAMKNTEILRRFMARGYRTQTRTLPFETQVPSVQEY